MNIRMTEIERQGVEETPKGIVHATKQKLLLTHQLRYPEQILSIEHFL